MNTEFQNSVFGGGIGDSTIVSPTHTAFVNLQNK